MRQLTDSQKAEANKAMHATCETHARDGRRWAENLSIRNSMMVAVALLGAITSGIVSAGEPAGPVDPATLLTLPWKQFDQTLGSGWRTYADRGSHHQAAELIVTYLAQRADLTESQRAISNFHAAAEFARVEDTRAALRHLDLASVPSGARGVPEDWNELVISTRAFLLGDRTALLASKKRVALMQKPAFASSPDTYLKYFGQRFGVWDEK